jgi:HNH endonuclease
MRVESEIERFWSKVHKADGCWLWTAARNKFGYGVFTGKGRVQLYSHRFSWKLHRGDIPEGSMVLHHCDNPPCVNPDHLFIGTAMDNMRDRHDKGRYATGEQSWSSTHKDRLARGLSNGRHTHPESTRRGETHGCAKLSLAQVEEIRSLIAGGLTHRATGKIFGVDRSTITAISLGKNWRSGSLQGDVDITVRPLQGHLEMADWTLDGEEGGQLDS